MKYLILSLGLRSTLGFGKGNGSHVFIDGMRLGWGLGERTYLGSESEVVQDKNICSWITH